MILISAEHGRQPAPQGALGPGLLRPGQAGQQERGHLRRDPRAREVLLSRDPLPGSPEGEGLARRDSLADGPSTCLVADRLLASSAPIAAAHDIPNARVDRSIQVDPGPRPARDRLRGQPGRADPDAGPPVPDRRPARGRSRRLVRPLRRGDRPLERQGAAGHGRRPPAGPPLARVRPGDRGAPALHVPLRGRSSPARPARRSRTPISPRARGPAASPSAGGTGS